MIKHDLQLEPDIAHMRELLSLTGERVIAHVASILESRVSSVSSTPALNASLREPLPEHGVALDGLLTQIFDDFAHQGVNVAHPGALSYVNGGGLFTSALADLVVATINPYVGYAQLSPGFVELEATVIHWICELLGMPPTAAGVLLSGGSAANLSAIITARRARCGDDFSRARLYTSDQVHHSINKAIALAGFPERALRLIPSDEQYRMRVDALAAAVAEDRRMGLEPCCVIATAGTTNTGAIDPLPAIAELAAAEGLWLHVDAAYGGLFALTERGRAALRGIEHADTVTVDPHKSLFLPFGTGCLIARSGKQLRRAHQHQADYIDALTEHDAATNFAELSPEMSRNARGLRAWLPLKLHGAHAFREALNEKLDLARWGSEQLAATPGFELVAAPQLSTFAFRATWPGCNRPAQQDALNRRVLERVNRAGRVHLSGTRLHGRFTLRICVLSVRTHHKTVALCIEELQRALRSELSVHTPSLTASDMQAAD